MKPIVTDNILLRESKWENKLNQLFGRDFWKKMYRYNKNILFNNKIKYLNYQIIRGTLKTNNIVSKWKANVLTTCTFCLSEVEDIVHLFWNCPIVQTFLTSLTPFMDRLGITWPPMTMVDFVFGDSSSTPNSLHEYICLYLKHYIWVCRCLRCDLDVAAFRLKLISAVNIDLHLHRGGGGGGVGIGNALFEFIGILANRLGIG